MAALVATFSALLARAPRSVHRRRRGQLESVPIEQVRRGDQLLVGSGEVVAVDGVTSRFAVLDESALTGESRPVEREAGTLVLRVPSTNVAPRLRAGYRRGRCSGAYVADPARRRRGEGRRGHP